MAIAKDERKKGLNCQQQACFDIHYLLDNSDSFRRDLQRIATSLEEIAACLKNNNQ